jgi:UDP-N-acetylmuramoyl-tripeptide--D-alanyl-D-alanine ligase
MATLDPGEAATIAHGAWAEGHPVSPLTSFAIDSRKLEPGQAFVALKTERRDGHDFLEQARENGALCAIVSEPNHGVQLPQMVVEDPLSALHSLARVWRQRFPGTVIGITGSYGKTTVKEILGTVMGAQWFRTYANLNNTLGVPLSLLELNARHDAGAIIEAGINLPGEMEILADLIDPDIAIITAVGPAHLERLGDLDGVAREKAKLATGVREGGQVILPLALMRYDAFREIPQSIQVHAIAVNASAEDAAAVEGLRNVSIYHYKWTEDEHSRGVGRLETGRPMPTGLFSFRTGSAGMISNLALVVHTALHLHVPPGTLQARLDSWRPFLHRGETFQLGHLQIYVDCYNANPGSMLDSVSRFKNLFAGHPHLYVLGSMDELGENSVEWHRNTARQLDLPAGSSVYLLGHGAKWMGEGLGDAGIPADSIRIVDDLELVRRAVSAFAGAVFLKASRSYRLEALIPEGAQPC